MNSKILEIILSVFFIILSVVALIVLNISERHSAGEYTAYVLFGVDVVVMIVLLCVISKNRRKK